MFYNPVISQTGFTPVLWNADVADLNGVTIADGGPLLQMCFQALNVVGTSPLTLDTIRYVTEFATVAGVLTDPLIWNEGRENVVDGYEVVQELVTGAGLS